MEVEAVLVTVTDAADKLGVNHQFVRKLIKSGELPAIHLNARAVRVRSEDLDAWIAGRESRGVA
ncbi:hypothetical protein BJD99_01005 [Rhodococcus sp. 1163]|uniref:helix-turn-helix transcriptional regulator n=1 Tax=Rhodococcus sp. 1163 TaxID=1905289 RepID=UPI000A02D0F9|nr:helix-turn-helix domain-containing protein [Rhodococcus sp. 1163]ORI11750.1 hypothetical protein BJD99_01005 [Rhodococcus sp. 1163]